MVGVWRAGGQSLSPAGHSVVPATTMSESQEPDTAAAPTAPVERPPSPPPPALPEWAQEHPTRKEKKKMRRKAAKQKRLEEAAATGESAAADGTESAATGTDAPTSDAAAPLMARVEDAEKPLSLDDLFRLGQEYVGESGSDDGGGGRGGDLHRRRWHRTSVSFLFSLSSIKLAVLGCWCVQHQ